MSTRRAIYSPAKSARIVEEVADKHGIEVPVMLCAAWRRDMVTARAEVVYRLRTELSLPYATIAEKLGTVPSRAHSLFTEHEKRAAQLRRLMPVPDPDGRIRELEQEIARLTGASLAERLSERLGLQLRCGILLAIITEAYPRFVRLPVMIELYDQACEHLGYGMRRGANTNLMSKNAGDLSAAFRAKDWLEPLETNKNDGARRLTDPAAAWLSPQFSAPRWSLVEMERERRSGPVGVEGGMVAA